MIQHFWSLTHIRQFLNLRSTIQEKKIKKVLKSQCIFSVTEGRLVLSSYPYFALFMLLSEDRQVCGYGLCVIASPLAGSPDARKLSKLA